MTETIPPPAATTDAIAARLTKLERHVKVLRRKLRRADLVAEALIDWTPEMEAELDRRIADMKANPGVGMTIAEFEAKTNQKYGLS